VNRHAGWFLSDGWFGTGTDLGHTGRIMTRDFNDLVGCAGRLRDCPGADGRGRELRMLYRRSLLAAPAIALAARARAATGSFQSLLVGVRADARRAGIAPATLDRAFAGLQPNPKVLERDQHQPEFTMTWAQYRALLITDQRIANGRVAFAQNRDLLVRVRERFAVDPGVIVGIWGLESSFGGGMGDFRVVEALATLAWEGRRASFFRGELIAALRILDHGDVTPGRMLGSYAGAMGQPQFMPSSYLRYAVDFDGDGRRDIWTSKPDVLGSIANYLASSGWRSGESWGQPVTLPANFDASMAGRDNRRAVGDWARVGVRAADGHALAPAGMSAAVVLPDGMAGDAFLVYANFAAIRRYNPSDYYALVVGLLGDTVVA
jgi:membrane-bound lytic murein transglycosylase B